MRIETAIISSYTYSITLFFKTFLMYCAEFVPGLHDSVKKFWELSYSSTDY
jgi:hypothetical protein